MGYSFAAGSTEDGGGHPLFREGMTKRDGFVENLLRAAGAGVVPSEEFRNCHAPKPILLATGLSNPPQHEQKITLGLVRIGSLVLVAGSGEFTTMTGRRICEAVAKALEVTPKNVVFAGYANDFAGYVTTYEEYQTQQYEGAHTLFGPWTEAGQRQEFVRLARAIKDNLPVDPTAQPEDMRKRVENSWRDGPDEADPTSAQFGNIVVQPEKSYVVDDLATAVFWTGRPSNGYQRGQRYFTIERLNSAKSNEWEPVLRDGQWEATCQWQQMIVETEAERKKRIAAAKATAYTLNAKPLAPTPEPFQVTIQWSIPTDALPGKYRIVHHGRFKKNGQVEFFEATSSTFEIVK
jgi:neutral ceramidase